MEVDVKEALLWCRQHPSLTEDDRAHIDRWMAEARDPVWQKIVAAIETADRLPPIQGGFFCFVVFSSLRCRRYAEEAVYETKAMKKERELEAQKRREGRLALASDIEDIVRRVRAHRRKWEAPPISATWRETEAQQALAWLEQQSRIIRRSAESSSDFSDNFVPETVSRQTGGVEKRPHSRQLGVFMKKMVNCMHQSTGNPRYEFVAKLTNVAFPNADFGAAEVRQRCRRRTRYTRR